MQYTVVLFRCVLCLILIDVNCNLNLPSNIVPVLGSLLLACDRRSAFNLYPFVKAVNHLALIRRPCLFWNLLLFASPRSLDAEPSQQAYRTGFFGTFVPFFFCLDRCPRPLLIIVAPCLGHNYHLAILFLSHLTFQSIQLAPRASAWLRAVVLFSVFDFSWWVGWGLEAI